MCRRVFSMCLCTLIILVIATGCTSKKESKETANCLDYSNVECEPNIGKYSVKDFMERSKEMINAVYAPESASQFNKVASEYKDIMTGQCIKQVTKTISPLTGIDYTNSIKFKVEKYGYTEHQNSGNRKLLYNIDVTKSGMTWNLYIELDIDDSVGKICDINVW